MVCTLIPRSHETFKQEDSLFECLDEKKEKQQNIKRSKTQNKIKERPKKKKKK